MSDETLDPVVPPDEVFNLIVLPDEVFNPIVLPEEPPPEEQPAPVAPPEENLDGTGTLDPAVVPLGSSEPGQYGPIERSMK